MERLFSVFISFPNEKSTEYTVPGFHGLEGLNTTSPPEVMLVSPRVSGEMVKSPGGNASPAPRWRGISESWILRGASTEISPEVKDEIYLINAGSGSVSFRFQVQPSIVKTAPATARIAILRQMPCFNVLNRCVLSQFMSGIIIDLKSKTI